MVFFGTVNGDKFYLSMTMIIINSVLNSGANSAVIFCVGSTSTLVSRSSLVPPECKNK